MNTPIIVRLIIKDLLIWRKLILSFCGASAACVALLAVLYHRIPYLVFMNLGFTLLVTPTAALGIVLLMQTNVFEKAKSTQHFIMSLPLTPSDFMLAKLLVNVPVFAVIWLAISLAAFYFAFGLGLLPAGCVPYMTMVFLGIFVAYICILSVSMSTQSLGTTVAAIMFFEVLTSAYLWMILYLDPIRSVIDGTDVVWNSTEITILVIQTVSAMAAVVLALFLQSRKRDFI
jgi:hypothetical protein